MRSHLNIAVSIVIINLDMIMIYLFGLDDKSNNKWSPIKIENQPFLFDTSSIQSIELDDFEDEEIKDLVQIANTDLRFKVKDYKTNKIQQSIRLQSDSWGASENSKIFIHNAVNTSVGASIANWFHQQKLGLSKASVLIQI